MKKLTLIFVAILFIHTAFSQNKIVKQYNEKNYEKCMDICNKHIKKNTELKQTAYLYKSLLNANVYKENSQAVSYLYRLRTTKDFQEFYKTNKTIFKEVQNSILENIDSLNNIQKSLPLLKKLSKLYLYRFEFLQSNGSANFKNQSMQTGKNAEYLKYRILLKYTQILNTDISLKKDLKVKEIILLSSILLVSKPIDNLKAVYNEIYAYLQNNSKLSGILDNLCLKYAKKADFEYKPIGNPKNIKKTINYEKVKERVKNSSNENEKTIEKLSNYLTNNFNEAEKIYAIYHWIDTNIKYKNDSTSEVGVNSTYKESEYGNKMVRTTQSAKVVLQNKFAVCEGYASLFTALCSTSGIVSKYVSGKSASSNYILAYHGWNIVKINKRWYLIDVTWGDEEYFLADNIMFNKKHYTANDKQLLFAPYSEKYFLKNAQKYAELISSNKKDSVSMFKLACVYYENKEYNKAIKTFNEFGETYKKTFDYHYYLGLSYSFISDKENANIEMTKALEIKPNNIEMLLQISGIYRNNYKFKEAYKYLNKAKKIKPDKNSIHRSEIYLLHKMKKYDKALIIADSLVINQPKDIENLIVRAYLYTNNNKYKKGIADCEAVLKKDNANTNALTYLSHCWQGLKNYEKALFYINKQLEINPNSYWTLSDKAFLLSLMKNYKEAYELTKKLTKIRPLNQSNWSNLSWYSILNKRYGEAIIYAEKSIAINKITEVWNSLALAYIYTGEFTKAEKIYLEYKDKKYPISASYETYSDFFVKWINYLSDNNLHHKDFVKALEILKVTNKQ